MNDNTWILENESRIFSIVKAKTKADVTALYPKARYTTVDENINSKTVFPTIYISELSSGQEVGKDLEGKSINGIISTYQVRVTTNTSKSDCKKVMGFILNGFKDLSFDCVSAPVTTTNNDMHTCIARFRRVIGASDIL